MSDIIKKIFGDKKAWNAMEARAKALPDEYDFVYH
jgi:DNA-binding ferritin-like protein (Dps family)